MISALPAGPTCHTGTTSCFGNDLSGQGFAELEGLWNTISDRIADPNPESYTASLAAAGPELTGRKLVEEATETLIAAMNGQRGETSDRIVEEAADVVYHLLALLAEREVPASRVIDELRRRAR